MIGSARLGGSLIEYQLMPGVGRDRPELVFLHEGLGSLSLWRDFPARIAAATGATTLVYSRPGHGRSGPPSGPRGVDYLHVEARDLLPAVLAFAGFSNPFLVGHSDGATIALLYAAAGLPTRGLILEAPHVFVEDLTVAGIRNTVTAWQGSDLSSRLGRHHNDVDALFSAWSGIWLAPEFRSWNIEDELPAVTCPVLAIQGEDDEYGTAAQVQAIVRQAGGPARSLLLPKCGHTPHRDQPDAVMAAVLAFLHRYSLGI